MRIYSDDIQACKKCGVLLPDQRDFLQKHAESHGIQDYDGEGSRLFTNVEISFTL